MTVREPVSAMFSLYVELYHRYQRKGMPFSKLVLHDNDFAIYNYDIMLGVLYEYFDPGRIHLQSFERLVKGDYRAISDFLDNPKFGGGVTLKNHNQKKKTKTAVMVAKRLELRWITRIYHLLGGERNKFALALKRIANSPIQKLRGMNYKSVPVPTLDEVERQKLTKEMSGTMDKMAEQFGVKY